MDLLQHIVDAYGQGALAFVSTMSGMWIGFNYGYKFGSSPDTHQTVSPKRVEKRTETDQEYDDPWNEAMNSTQERIDTI